MKKHIVLTCDLKRYGEHFVVFHKSPVDFRYVLCARVVRQFFNVPRNAKTIRLVLTNKPTRDAVELRNVCCKLGEWYLSIDGGRQRLVHEWLGEQIMIIGDPAYAWIELNDQGGAT